MHSCACTCADLAGPLARLLVESLGSCQHGLIDRLVGGHHQQFWLIVILTISKLIFIIYLPLLHCLLILRLGGAGGRGLLVGRVGSIGMGRKGREAKRVGGGGGGKKKGGMWKRRGRRKPGMAGGKEAWEKEAFSTV